MKRISLTNMIQVEYIIIRLNNEYYSEIYRMLGVPRILSTEMILEGF